MASRNDDNKTLRCSFCNKTQDQVRKLIAGPGAYICDECIEICSDIMKDELANMTDISKQSLSNYANESNVPPYENVLKIAKTLEFPPDYFMVEDLCTTATDNTYFRSQAAATKTAQRSQAIKMEYVAKMYDALLDYVDWPELDLPKVEFEQNDDLAAVDTPEFFEKIEKLAEQVRQQWGLGTGPIENFQFVLESSYNYIHIDI